MKQEQPLVSIYCLTYNHENYLRDCLEGFMMQETNFPFEVIVHDDASIDGTQKILREYEEKYPDIIRPIYQKENQFSLGINPITKFIFPLARGKYVAVCEGDDYWTDKEKLQRQVEIMEEHPECHFCVCGVQEVSLNKTPLGYNHPNIKIDEEIIEPDVFIKYAGSYSFQTSSYLMRYADWSEYILNPPEFKEVSNIGDITMLLYFGSLGKTAYIDRFMSCYRRGAPSSFSTGRNQWSEEKRIQHFESQLKVWSLFDDYSGKRFHGVCVKKVSDLMFGYCILLCRANELLRKENREYFDIYRFLKKGYIFIASLFKNAMKKQYLKTMQNREREKQKRWEQS